MSSAAADGYDHHNAYELGVGLGSGRHHVSIPAFMAYLYLYDAESMTYDNLNMTRGPFRPCLHSPKLLSSGLTMIYVFALSASLGRCATIALSITGEVFVALVVCCVASGRRALYVRNLLTARVCGS